MHTTTGRWRLGLGLALVTTFLWGLLPIALKNLLEGMDPFTISWYRFLSSSILVGLYLKKKNSLPELKKIDRSGWYLIMIAILGLCGNYILYLLGLDHISPSSAQVVIQLAPMFFLIGGILIFKERFAKEQWVGFAILISGLLLFFNQKMAELFSEFGDYTIGVLFIIASAIAWAAYALSQKQLLKDHTSGEVMFIIYVAGTILFLPLSKPETITGLSMIHLLLLVFCALNTLVAYGCFAEALNHLEASRVSTILAVVPLITVSVMEIGVRVVPHFQYHESLNNLSIVGALFVVIGSMVTSFGRRSEGR